MFSGCIGEQVLGNTVIDSSFALSLLVRGRSGYASEVTQPSAASLAGANAVIEIGTTGHRPPHWLFKEITIGRAYYRRGSLLRFGFIRLNVPGRHTSRSSPCRDAAAAFGRSGAVVIEMPLDGYTRRFLRRCGSAAAPCSPGARSPGVLPGGEVAGNPARVGKSHNERKHTRILARLCEGSSP